MACAYHVVTVIEGQEIKCLGPEATPDGIEAMTCNWVTNYYGKDESPNARYVAALYLSVMTISTVGYGDIVPVTMAERVYLIFAMLIGASVYAYVVGSVCGIVSAMDQKQTEFFNLMDSLNVFIKDTHLNDDLSHRLRSYFRYRRYQNDVSEWHSLLNQLSPSLRGEVAMQLNSHWIEKVPFFADCPDTMLIELAFILHTETFPPEEIFIYEQEEASKMYLLKKGVVTAKGRIFTAGAVLGEDMLVGSRRPNGFNARTLTYSDVITLKRHELIKILEDFPEVSKRLRRNAVRRIFKDHVVAYARAYKLVLEKNTREQLEIDGNTVELNSKSPLSNMNSLFGMQDGLMLSFANKLSVIMKADPDEAVKLEKATIKVQKNWRGRKERNHLSQMAEMAEKMAKDPAHIAAKNTSVIVAAIEKLSSRIEAIEKKIAR